MTTTTTITYTDDGSGAPLACAMPKSINISDLPNQDTYIKATGVSSCVLDAQQQAVPLLRLREKNDWQPAL